MSISAELVKTLRERTGAGMMDCKKALLETNGDIEAAVEVMRKSGQAKADKKASRIAAEGVILIKASNDQKAAVMLEINCETDFVARDENFKAFAERVAETALAKKANDVASLSDQAYGSESQTIEEARKALIAKIGENINLRRVTFIDSSETLGWYIHGGRIGVLVKMKGGNQELAKDIAMHIAANNPLVIHQQQVPNENIEKEREIYAAQAQTTGKPADIIAKMVDGRIKKYLDEVSLLGQPFVKDPSINVAALLRSKNAEVLAFARFEVGEGIEKPVVDFAKEVMSQIGS